jgi:phospholipid/cholesterol/gamma-HCH transport system permease protein
MSTLESSTGNPYARGAAAAALRTRPGGRLKAAGEMGSLLVRVARETVKAPFPWIRESISEISVITRRCAIPLVLSHGVYLIGFGIILFGNILISLGISDRIGGTVFLIWSREIATWITAMIFAGVVGSAVTADLGARKIREELDAMSVLGVDQIRTLVVPRVVAMSIALPALALASLIGVNIINFIVSPARFGFSSGVYFDSLANIIRPSDLLLTTLLKNMIIGVFVAIVACYKGLSCEPGAEGVGRAVNQTVVITFFWIWLINNIFNLAYFTAFPDVSVLRG